MPLPARMEDLGKAALAHQLPQLQLTVLNGGAAYGPERQRGAGAGRHRHRTAWRRGRWRDWRGAGACSAGQRHPRCLWRQGEARRPGREARRLAASQVVHGAGQRQGLVAEQQAAAASGAQACDDRAAGSWLARRGAAWPAQRERHGHGRCHSGLCFQPKSQRRVMLQWLLLLRCSMVSGAKPWGERTCPWRLVAMEPQWHS